MNKIKTGDWINDYKGKMVYRIVEVATIKHEYGGNETVIIGEAHTKRDSPAIGFDLIILDSRGVIPESEKWGEKAWSYNTLKMAQKALEGMLGKESVEKTAV